MKAKGWITHPVAEIAARQKNALVGGPFGSDLVSRDYVDDGVPVIRGANMGKGRWIAGEYVFVTEDKADSLAANCAKPGDLVFTQRGTIGQVALVPDGEYERYLISQSQMKLTVDSSKADPLFLFYAFSSSEHQDYIQQNAIRTGVPHTNLSILKNTPVRLPSLSEQQRIAAVLSALDAKIELNQRLNAELEGLAKLLYDYWFVQYDFPLSPAQAAALRKPHLTGHPYRSSGGPMVFNEQLKREIPMGWEVGRFDHICRLNAHTWTHKNHPDRVTYVDLANTKNGEILFTQDHSWEEAPSRARRILTPGDTIFGTVRPGNRSFALVPPTDQVLTGSTGFAVLTPKFELHREFLYLSVTTESNLDRLTTVASGAAYPAVNPEVVTEQLLALPPHDTLEAFHQALASSFDLIATHRTQSHHLAQLRDWLLPMLMNGQASVTL